MSRRGLTTSGALIFTCIAIAACSGREAAPEGPCRYGDPSSCPDGTACALGGGMDFECLPTLCVALRSCCGHTGDSLGCEEVVLAASAETCATELREHVDAGTCTADPDGGYCNGEGVACSYYPSWTQGTCCSGDVCVTEEGDEVLEGSCRPGLAVGEPCDMLEDHCLAGTECSPNRTCAPLLQEGESCDLSTADCDAGLTCEDRRCRRAGAPGGEGEGEGGGEGEGEAPIACDPASCSGFMSECAGGYCFSCSWACDGNSCAQTCT